MVKVGKGGQKIVPIIGLDYKDKDADAMRFLRQGGDPYDFSIKDQPVKSASTSVFTAFPKPL